MFPSLEYRVRFYVPDSGGLAMPMSPWHDIPLRNPDCKRTVLNS